MCPSALTVQDNDVNYGFGFQLIPTLENNTIVLILHVDILTFSQKTVLSIDSQYDFYVEDLASYVHKNDNGDFEIEGLSEHLLSVAVGTTRGLIVSKTAGTSISRFPMPIINVHEMLKHAKKS